MLQMVGAGPYISREDVDSSHIKGAAVAQWGKGVVLQPQGRRFDPRSSH